MQTEIHQEYTECYLMHPEYIECIRCIKYFIMIKIIRFNIFEFVSVFVLFVLDFCFCI